MSKTILVTGGAGYIGSHTCKLLAERGYTPLVYDNLSTGHRDLVRFGELVEGDLHERQKLADVIRTHQPEAVIHFAASAYVGESVTDPASYYDNNVGGSLSLLNAMRDGGCDRLVFSSTCATYGIPKTVPIPVDHPQHPVNPYGRTKLVVEGMIADFVAAYGFRATRLRYFNAAGADQDGEIGERHIPETHLIPNAISAALVAGHTLEVYGTDYDTDDGTCIRDYIHVRDLAEAHVLALKELEAGPVCHTYNLGTGHGTSVHEVVSIIEAITGKNVSRVMRERREGDPPVLVADYGNTKQRLGWNPAHSDMATIIKTAVAWQEQELRSESQKAG